MCWLSVDGWAGSRISLGKVDILVGVGIKVVTTKAGMTCHSRLNFNWCGVLFSSSDWSTGVMCFGFCWDWCGYCGDTVGSMVWEYWCRVTVSVGVGVGIEVLL